MRFLSSSPIPEFPAWWLSSGYSNWTCCSSLALTCLHFWMRSKPCRSLDQKINLKVFSLGLTYLLKELQKNRSLKEDKETAEETPKLKKKPKQTPKKKKGSLAAQHAEVMTAVGGTLIEVTLLIEDF